MDALRRTFDQFMDLYRSMSGSQRGTLIVVPLLIIGAFGVLMFNGPSSTRTPVSFGKAFSLEERMHAEQTFINAGLTDFETEGQRILAPKGDVERYNAALIADNTLPDNWAKEWEKQLDLGPFAGNKEREQRMRYAQAKIISRMIMAVPDYEDAIVFVAPSERKSYARGNKPVVTATVSVKPKRGRELTVQQAQSLRTLVAGAVPDLNSEDVIVQDQSTGVSYTADRDGDPFDSLLLKRIREFTQFHQNKIVDTLKYIPKVLVSVNVDVENLRQSVERTQTFDKKTSVDLRQTTNKRTETLSERRSSSEPGQVSNSPRQLQSSNGPVKSNSIDDETTDTFTAPSSTTQVKEFIAAMPKAVRVTVSIPEDYYEAVALKQGPPVSATDEEKTEFGARQGALFRGLVDKERTKVEQEVSAKVLNLIPLGSPTNAINVSSYTPVDAELPKFEQSMVELADDLFSQWGGALGLTLFALWALWMLNKSMARTPDEETQAPPAASLASMQEEDDDEDDEDKPPKPKELNQRDLLQNAVRDNPEMAAAVVSKWIKASVK